MKKRIIASLLLLLFAVSFAYSQAEDTVPVLQRVYMHTAAGREFLTRPYLNPALNYYRQSYSLSALEAGAAWEKQSRATQAELGDGWRGVTLSGDSYVHLSAQTRAWGNAYYRNGTRRNVQWNESSDYELLYPYVAADTIGGDMKSETYFFRGGYAAVHGRWSFGGEFAYRALQEYRDFDPRPNNKVADLQGRVGASCRIRSAYALALSAEARKYKQNDGLVYYDELGVSKTFHLTGLGSSYTRFDGTRTDVRYQGHSYGAGVDLLPVHADGGWSGSLNYRHSYYEKILFSVNDLVLNEMRENDLQGEVAWVTSRKGHRFLGLKTSVEYRGRKGTENLYGDAVNSIYPKIAEAEQFEERLAHAAISGCYEQEQTANWRWSLHPAIGYLHRKEKYGTPAGSLAYSLWNASLALASTHRWNRKILYTRVYTAYRGKIDATRSIGGQAAHPYALTVLQQNLEMQSCNRAEYGISLRWSQHFGNVVGYADAGWQQTHYSNHENGRMIRISIGVSL